MNKVLANACLVSCLIGLLASATARAQETDEKVQVVRIPSGARTGHGFSLGLGKVIPIVDRKTGQYHEMMDFFWDVQGSGLVLNNTENGPGFVGKAQIADLGNVALKRADQLPTNGWHYNIVPKKGHSYAVKLANGKDYGFMHVLDIDPKSELLTISWRR